MDFGDFTLFDIFLKNKDIYLICSINNEPLDVNYLNVSINHINLVLKEKIIKLPPPRASDPISIFIYEDFIDDDNDINIKERFFIEVTYKGKKYNKEIEETKTKTKSDFLCLTTLFKNDYDLFPNYYKYYKKQGVQHFFMYYNGSLNDLNDEIKEIFNYDDVTLIEWDFRYWNNKKIHRYKHHAQLGQIHHALYKYGKDNYKYMIFNDLDEYLFIPNIKLIDYIKSKSNVSIFGFKNLWAETYDGNHKFQETLYVDEVINYHKRSKNIYMTSAVKLLNVHKPFRMSVEEKNVIRDLDNIMYHFSSWTGGAGVVAFGGEKRKYNKYPNVIKINLDFLKLDEPDDDDY